MSREIRKVPKGWQHPTYKDLVDEGCDVNCFVNYDSLCPMYDQSYKDACDKWIKGCMEWHNGTADVLKVSNDFKDRYPYYWDFEGPPPEKQCYRFGKWDFKEEDATCYQIYETVSEGTPCSPVFDTELLLIEYLKENGYSEQAAIAFVNDKWAPSLAIVGDQIYRNIEACGIPKSGDSDD